MIVPVNEADVSDTGRDQSEERLRRIKQEADRARQAKARFIDASSNDIRQHLQTLNLLNHALQKLAEAPRTQEIVAKQGIAITQLGEYMNSLLELSELESGEVKLEISDVPVEEAIRSLCDEFEYQAEAKGLRLEFEGEPGVARSDRVLLSRIVRVLISNAIRYTEEGKITVSAKFEEEGLRITVQDTGIGIAPDEVSRIFDEFYRVDNSPARRQGGLGLGLSIVERSIKHLNAKLEVESELGRGSSFSLLMPAAA